MTNRLKSLELNGYKTFATKTLFEFAGNITVVVGPNGSGKSNVADAIRWVLGEQSFSLLRGRKTEDMIFSGSESRARSGMASATVTFDNSDGWLPIDFSEVSVTRRAYRDGQNEYLINNQRVRLRDVTELLANSGLAERTYTVIGQGLVDTALTLKSDERRRLFEEAAGIGLYRYRKEQALRRLDSTRRNLDRVQDILAELRPRLRSLQRQAKRTVEYEQVRADLREVLRDWYGYHWHQSQRDIKEARDVNRHQEKNLQEARENHSQVEKSITSLRDKITDLRGQLNSWHGQLAQIHSQREETSRDLAVNSERRRALQADQNRLEIEIARIAEENTSQKSRLDLAISEVEQRKKEVEDSEKELEKVRNTLVEQKDVREAIETSVQSHQRNVIDLTTKKAEKLARKVELEGRTEKSGEEISAIEEQLEQILEKTTELELEFSEAERITEETRKKISKEEKALETDRSKIDSLQTEREKIQTEQIKLSADITRDNAELEILVQAESNLTGYASGAKVLIEAVKEGQLDGSGRVLGDQLNVASDYEIAIAAALGDFVDAILLKNEKNTDIALRLLEETTAKAALLPVNEIAPSSVLSGEKEDGFIGIAADLVEVTAELKPAVDLLLGQVIVVKDRKTARRMITRYDSHIKAVTLRGEIFHSSGTILVDSAERAGTIRRPRKRQELEKRLAETDKKLTEVNRKLQDIDEQEILHRNELISFENELETVIAAHEASRSQLGEISNQLDQIRNQFNWQQDQKKLLDQETLDTKKEIGFIDSELEKIQAEITQTEESLHGQTLELSQLSIEAPLEQVSMWETQLAVCHRAQEHAKQIKDERKNNLEKTQNNLQSQQSRHEELSEQISALDKKMDEMRSSEGGIGDQIQELQNLIEPAETELNDVEQEQVVVMTEEAEVRQVLNISERHAAQAQIALVRKQETLDSLRQRIEDDFGLVEFIYQDDVSGPTPLPFGEMVEQLPVVTEISPDLEDTLKRQRMQLRRVGSVNPDAQQEYVEVNERHEFLTTQMADLQAAEEDIREVITELDALMDREFRKTFEIVAVEFKENFSRLFDGGAAKLVLTDTEKISETGIDIEARLPGKRPQRLALLSGGERSLTAAALVFSLVKVSPTPFCVMDEVDAMLDEVNVSRFRELLSELSQETQFVVITHNRHTVQAADVIYGITMRRDTTSQSISLKLEEVDEKYSS
jgi:chromosome segregation protein